MKTAEFGEKTFSGCFFHNERIATPDTIFDKTTRTMENVSRCHKTTRNFKFLFNTVVLLVSPHSCNLPDPTMII